MFLSFLRNIFRILMTRKWNRSKLKGLIYNHACGAHRYFLNREPKDFKNFNFMVDGCHMQGQRRMKKANPSTGRCHTAKQRWCSPFPGPGADALCPQEADPIPSACVLPQFHARIIFVLQCAQSVDNGENA